MKNIAIIGAQFGDEGKGAITNRFSVDYDWVIRFSGGDNVGAKVVRNDREYVHHLLPVVDYTRSQAKAYLGSEMVINMPALLEEIKTMEKDFPNVGKNTYVDIDAFIVKPEYIEEDKLTGMAQGTTYRGIKQAYRAKVERTGTRVYDLINNNAPIIKALKDVGVHFTTVLQMRETFEKSRLLFEGNQGMMLDLVSGQYPYITSSFVSVAGICAAGFHWAVGDLKVYGVAKPYITRSGGKKLITEMDDKASEVFVEKGGERGNTTGRARGIGYLDLPALKYACARGGIDAIVMTKLDIMNGIDQIQVCSSYSGKERAVSPSDFERATPEYTTVKGWENAKELKQIQPFLSFVEENVGVPVEFISVGVKKDDLIRVKNELEVLFPTPKPSTGFIKYGEGNII